MCSSPIAALSALPARCCHTRGYFSTRGECGKYRCAWHVSVLCLHFLPRSEQDWLHAIWTVTPVVKPALIPEPRSFQSVGVPTLPHTRLASGEAGSCLVRHLSVLQPCTVKI